MLGSQRDLLIVVTEIKLTEALDQCGFPQLLSKRKENMTNSVLLKSHRRDTSFVLKYQPVYVTWAQITSQGMGNTIYHVPWRTRNIWMMALMTSQEGQTHPRSFFQIPLIKIPLGNTNFLQRRDYLQNNVNPNHFRLFIHNSRCQKQWSKVFKMSREEDF